jgi:predicted DNA-binding transcriptional regulator YafY
LRSFGLDRIYEPIKLDRTFRKGVPKHILSFLNNMYGVFSLTNEEPMPVVLRADRLTTKFLSAYPIHDSQVVEKYDSGSSRITLTLIPTMELIQLVRSYGHGLSVLEPTWLVELIRNKKNNEFRR